ncbi:MAG TPA: VOC family protein [Dehalococcoidia bacterium]|nr:VOC family protein [Dehalococcoidia bacterium]
MTTGEDAVRHGVEAHLARDGKVSYMHIPAVDVARSGDFYRDVFGWDVREDFGPERRGFTDASGELIGAFVTNISVAPGAGIEPYIYVARIDDAVRAIEANGGTIMTVPYFESQLWIATFRDPAGNIMGIWQAGPR